MGDHAVCPCADAAYQCACLRSCMAAVQSRARPNHAMAALQRLHVAYILLTGGIRHLHFDQLVWVCSCRIRRQKDFAAGIGEVKRMLMYFIRKLKHNKLISLIMIAQFALALILLNKSLSVNAGYTVSTAQIAGIYGDASICRMQDKSDEAALIGSTADESDVTQRQAALYQWLKSSPDFSFLSYQKKRMPFRPSFRADSSSASQLYARWSIIRR